MDLQYISKKELLELTDISYGQLYRWKRKDIIPESWFIKKSSYTGQETFFPKQKIIERIEKIKELKDEYSLEELANFFSTNPKEVAVTIDYLLKQEIINRSTWELCKGLFSGNDTLKYHAILILIVCEKVQLISEDEQVNLCKFLLANHEEIVKGDYELVGARKADTLIWILFQTQTKWKLHGDTKIHIRFDIKESMDELNIKLSQIQEGL